MNPTTAGEADLARVLSSDPGLEQREPGDDLHSMPLRVSALYFVVATVWIVGSDFVLGSARSEPAADVVADVVKGLVFVAVTTALLWWVLNTLTHRHERRFRATVQSQRDLYRETLRNSSDVVVIVGESGRILYANHTVTEILGLAPDALIGGRGRDFMHPEDRLAAAGFTENVLSGAVASSTRTFRFAHSDGSLRSLELTAAPFQSPTGERAVIVNGRDVTDRAQGERDRRQAVTHDVTGLLDLATFIEVLDEICVAMERTDRAFIVVVVDIDRFRDINEVHGRSDGDRVLIETARRLEAALPQALHHCRHGSNSFAALVLGAPGDSRTTADSERIRALVDRVRMHTDAPIALDDARWVNVAASIGIGVVRSGEGDTPTLGAARLLTVAEQALSEARSHPDRFAVRELDDAAPSGSQATLIAALHHAVDRGEMVVWYQPKVRLGDFAIVGAEALLRWNHPDRGLLAPREFLHALETANLLGPVTRFVLRRALIQVREWQEAGHDYGVSVNLSLDDLRRGKFLADIGDALDETGVDPASLTLELTEHALMVDPDRCQIVVAQLREMGIRISIDDFGTGFSSFEHLRVFAIDELKVDRSFVHRLDSASADQAIVESVIELGRRLDVAVTAEGIETPAALVRLREMGCGLGQGFLLARPGPAAQFPDRIEAPAGDQTTLF